MVDKFQDLFLEKTTGYYRGGIVAISILFWSKANLRLWMNLYAIKWRRERSKRQCLRIWKKKNRSGGYGLTGLSHPINTAIYLLGMLFAKGRGKCSNTRSVAACGTTAEMKTVLCQVGLHSHPQPPSVIQQYNNSYAETETSRIRLGYLIFG